MGAVDTLCESELGAPVARHLFEAESGARVYGLELSDGRAVVVKTLREDPAYLAAVQDVQSALAAGGYPAPRPVFGPRAVDGRLAVGEELLAVGEVALPEDPTTRGLLARELVRLIGVCAPFAERTELRRAPFTPSLGSLWPRPHDVRFDFIATAAGAEWIDERAAAVVNERDAGEPVLGHADWRVEHLRFASGRLVAVYDWHRLAVAPEPALAGYAARGSGGAAEALGFLDDYERARGAVFTAEERACARAALVYAVAYAARCEHSDERLGIGFRERYREMLRELASG